MTGLVWIDTLHLSMLQQIGLACAMWVALSASLTRYRISVIHLLMLASCWNVSLSTDTRMLFQSCQYLQQYTWQQFLSEFAFQNYVKRQPPFYTFFVSRWPSLPAHQIITTAWAMLCASLMLALYGQRAKDLIATPIWLMMSTQPSNDLLLFGVILIVLRVSQLGYPRLAALLYGLTYLIKPLSVITLPFMVTRVGVPVLGGVAVWGLYVRWSCQYYFGITQWDFLLHQCLVR